MTCCAVVRDVSTAAAVLDTEYSVSEEEESDASEALSEEVAATKQQVDDGPFGLCRPNV